MMETRRALVEDAVGIAEVHVRSWQVAYRGSLPHSVLDGLDVEVRAEQWRANLKGDRPPEGNLWVNTGVAIENGRVIGFASVGAWRDAPEDSSLGELWAIYVHPDRWGSGAGFELLNSSLEQLASADVRTAYLWVLDDNDRARAFYERQGWSDDAVTKPEELGGATVISRRYSLTLDS